MVESKFVTIHDKLKDVLNAADFTNVKIIAVTKYVDTDAVLSAYDAGMREFGENKVQDARDKMEKLGHLHDIQWHFIGHLQRNKVKDVVGDFILIHSIDSLKLAEEVSKRACFVGIEQNILLQVNVSGEESKSGFNEKLLLTEFPKILSLDNIKITGLMTMAPYTEDKNIQRGCFHQLRCLRDDLEKRYTVHLPELSMGMSNDYRIAIECGATIVRLGSVLFK